MDAKPKQLYMHNEQSKSERNSESTTEEELQTIINDVKSESLINFKTTTEINKGINLAIDTSTHPSSARHAMMSPTAKSSAYTTTPSPIKSPVKTPLSPLEAGMIGQIIRHKKNSIAFFIDVLNGSSPTKDPGLSIRTQGVKLASVELDALKSPRSLQVNSAKQTAATEATSNQPSTTFSNKPEAQSVSSIMFPKIRTHLLRPPAKELKSRLEAKMQSATSARQQHLASRRSAIQRDLQNAKFRLMIHDSRQRLEKLRKQAKSEYVHSSVQLNREVLLRKTKEKFGARVEHAKRIMLINKMRRFMTLRRALSENFAELLQEPEWDHMETLQEDDQERWNIEKEIEATAVGDAQEAEEYHADFSSNYIFSLGSPKTKVENVAASIRKTKSLPDLVLKEGDDATFMELLDLLPPITRFTLRELEMDEMLGNAQLRHDILFDPDLQFKASDSDDEEGQAKAMAYWDEISEEVNEGKLYRIPLLLTEVRAILVELLPNGTEIKDEIMSKIDTNLINQEIEHGIMNPGPLIAYLADLMKTNCAPIRDVEVDKMVTACIQGDIVSTLRICFDILELMKLVTCVNQDYANHQLSRLRPYIVEHAVNFEWKYFKTQIDSGQLTLTNTIAWLTTAWKGYKARVVGSPNPSYDLYPEAFVDILSQAAKYNDEDIFPETLKMDLSKMVSFFNTWQDITILATIMIVFKQAAGPKCSNQDLIDAKSSIWILLNDSDSTMSHITLQMTHLAGKIRGKPMTPEECTGLGTVTEKTLASGSKLYDLVQNRVGMHLQQGITNQPIDMELLTKHGLVILKTEIEDLIKKIVPVCELNRAVYAKLYASIIDDIKQGLDQPSPSSIKILSE